MTRPVCLHILRCLLLFRIIVRLVINPTLGAHLVVLVLNNGLSHLLSFLIIHYPKCLFLALMVLIRPFGKRNALTISSCSPLMRASGRLPLRYILRATLPVGCKSTRLGMDWVHGTILFRWWSRNLELIVTVMHSQSNVGTQINHFS